MSNDVNYVNYTKRSLRDVTVVTLELFGSPIDCVDGMMKLNDIRKAYLVEVGAEDRDGFKQISKWLSTTSTSELLEYLEGNHEEFNYADMGSVKKAVEGKYGGTYVCKELAYHFAMWCDPRFAMHVLRAFDHLVHANFESARKTATVVAKPFIKLEWQARAERLIMNGMDPDDYFSFMISDLYFEMSNSLLDNPIDLRTHIYKNIGESLILERMLNGLELAWNYVDSETAVSDILTHFRMDPEFCKLEEVIRDFYEHNN